LINAGIRIVPGKQAESAQTAPGTHGADEPAVFYQISAGARSQLAARMVFNGTSAAQLQV